MINLKINDIEIQVEKGTKIIDAAKLIGVDIPTLCFMKDLHNAFCRICIVEIVGREELVSSCNTVCLEGMEVYTSTEKVLKARDMHIELLLSNHPTDCFTCVRSKNCELQTLASELHVRKIDTYGEINEVVYKDETNSMVRDTTKCVLCGRCVSTCKKVQSIDYLGLQNEAFHLVVAPNEGKNCISCGQCLINCPVGAITEKESFNEVLKALKDKNKFVVVQTAPAVRTALGEEFGLPIGTRVTGKMVSSLKRLGFDKVFDTNYGADLTIIEEGNEFLDRFKNNKNLPMITSCCPGWVDYAESEYSDYLNHLSSCKSPMTMLGSMLKNHYTKVKGIDPKDIYVVAVMPCTAKKEEIKRPNMKNKDGLYDVDAVITTRELANLIRIHSIDFKKLPDEEFDQDIFGTASGAGTIFGVTGGVMEAALRTVKETLEGKHLEKIKFEEVRGQNGVKEATININGTEVSVCVVSSIANAKKIMEEIKEGTSKYHFVEVMACPGGCINGGGQPIISSRIKNDSVDYKSLRASVLYKEDEILTIRKSHENPQIIELYENFLEKPNSHIAHELLHTTFSKKNN